MMKKNKILIATLVLIAILAGSTIGTTYAKTTNTDTSIGWLPIHITDKQAGRWLSYVYMELIIDNHTYMLGWGSWNHQKYKEDVYVSAIETVEARMEHNNTINVKFYADRVACATTAWTKRIDINNGDNLSILTDTYGYSGWINIYLNNSQVASARS
ncbi:MAG: hypothetical protein LBB45_06010 [Methanobrevibacter sp.]|jgi:hypothetical protein|nr:hypothetical protein [Candidatus Methanovirga basalitermitum]